MICHFEGHDYRYELESLVMMFFPGEKITVVERRPEEGDFISAVRKTQQGEALLLAQLHLGTDTDVRQTSLPLDAPDFDRACERAFAVLLYRMLSAKTGRTPQWGILTGIRPIKLFRSLRQQGKSDAEIRARFENEYLMDPQKIDLALRTCGEEREILAQPSRALQPLSLHSVLPQPLQLLLVCLPFHRKITPSDRRVSRIALQGDCLYSKGDCSAGFAAGHRLLGRRHPVHPDARSDSAGGRGAGKRV